MATALASHVESWVWDHTAWLPRSLLCRARAVDALGCHELALTDALEFLGSGNPRLLGGCSCCSSAAEPSCSTAAGAYI
ncbi:hypothetical protein E2562_007124 [Oryza meyeriana var. granulata]|uniref:Uncharacterized protein n=1 Tax=Oryza meyeriana var. granulata TaxID=110450 RepID=A0A6G1F501_9ORYZ|nr:hypothetical protein E2562_007124 [Oryza meyeriana var. granulata]